MKKFEQFIFFFNSIPGNCDSSFRKSCEQTIFEQLLQRSMESNPDIVKNRRRPGEPQIVVVGMRLLWNVVGTGSLLVGAAIALVLYYYHNDYADLELQAVTITISFFGSSSSFLRVLINLSLTSTFYVNTKDGQF